MSDYIQSMRQWCQNILESYHDSHSRLRQYNSSNKLKDWKQQLLQLQEELSNDSELDIMRIFERANELHSKLNEYYDACQNNQDPESPRVQTHSGFVQIGKHTLPPLPYSYDALEPFIHHEIMLLHHDKHHKSYVDGLNKAEKEMQKARTTKNFELIKHWEREAAFHGAGHYLHTIFWSIMTPKGGGKPSGMLMREINNAFGDFDHFKKHFSEAANNVEGVGWAIVVWSPRSRRLEILQAEKHQNLSQWDVVPILVLDVWEHAYYLQYQNDRKKYIENWWNIVNWREVERRFHEAQQLRWKPY